MMTAAFILIAVAPLWLFLNVYLALRDIRARLDKLEKKP